MNSQITIIHADKSPELCEILHDICICMEAIGGYATMLVDGSATFNPGDYATIESRRGHFQVRLPIYGPITSALQGSNPNAIQIQKELKNEPKRYAVYSSRLKQPIESVFASNFLRYYVIGEAKLISSVGSDWSWGDNWRFAWAIRNALAHNGRIEFRNAQKRAVEWDGLRYDASNNQHPVFEQDIGPADLISLMIDMDNELRRISS